MSKNVTHCLLHSHSQYYLQRRLTKIKIFSKNNKDARIILYGILGAMIVNRQRRLVKKKQVKRFWRWGILNANTTMKLIEI